MALTIKTNRMLWGRAASRCSFPDCRRELVIDSLETGDPSLVGKAAHIVAEQPSGPRGDPVPEIKLAPLMRAMHDAISFIKLSAEQAAIERHVGARILVNSHANPVRGEIALCTCGLLNCMQIFLDAQLTSQFPFPVVHEKTAGFSPIAYRSTTMTALMIEFSDTGCLIATSSP
jgi:hypothetical protein